MVVKKNYYSYIALAVVVFVLFSLQQSTGDGDVTQINREQYAREGGLPYDGDNDAWFLDLDSVSDAREVGETLNIKVLVGSDETYTGTKYVQCSILDGTENTWLNEVSRAGLSRETIIVKPTTEYNCVRDEPYTKTAKVELPPFEAQKVTFKIQIPNYPEGHSYVVFCDTFEQCWSSGDPLSSDSFALPITVKEGPDCGTRNFKAVCYNDDVWFEDECGERTYLSEACEWGYKCDPETVKCVNKKQETQCVDECSSTNQIICVDAYSYNKCKVDEFGCYYVDNALYKLNPEGKEFCQNNMIKVQAQVVVDDSPPRASERKTLWEWIASLF